MDPVEPTCFPDARAWRRWLEENHEREDGLWLMIYKTSSDKKGLRYEEALDEALSFGWIDGQLKRIDADRHMIKFTPRRKGSVWSRKNRERAKQLISAGRMTPAGEARIEEAKRAGLWDAAYTNKKRDGMPPDLKAALARDKTAQENFQRYANSYSNMYIGWVNAAKTKETRERRIKQVVERARENRKPGV